MAYNKMAHESKRDDVKKDLVDFNPFHSPKYAVFTALWGLMTMNPERYAFLIDCNSKDKKDLYDEKKPLLLLESDKILFGRPRTQTHYAHGSYLTSLEKPLNVKQQFVDCVKEEVEDALKGGISDFTGEDVPSERFCCNLYHKATKMYLYDKVFSSLYYFGEYEKDTYRKGKGDPEGLFRKIDSESFLDPFWAANTPERAFLYLNEFFGKHDIMGKELNCTYFGTTFDAPPGHQRSDLFDCLRGGVRKGGWERVPLKRVFEQPKSKK